MIATSSGVATANNLSPVFICGTARSGTTLLVNLLDSHPELAVFPGETYFYFNILDRGLASLILRLSGSLVPESAIHQVANRFWRRMISPDRSDMQKLLEQWSRSFDAAVPGLVSASIDPVIEHSSLPRGYWDLYSNVYERLATGAKDESRYFVEKTPSNERYVAFIEAEFPNQARYIHLVRDPRDVAASWLRRLELAPQQRRGRLLRICHLWSQSVRLGAMYAARYPGRYALLRYEELVRETDLCMTGLSRFLQIEDHPCLRRTSRRGRLTQINSSYPDRPDIGTVSKEQIGRYRDALSASEVEFTEKVLFTQMTAAGYQIVARVDGPDHLVSHFAPSSIRDRLSGRIRLALIHLNQRRATTLPFLVPGNQ